MVHADWREVEQMVADGKHQAAIELVRARLDAARANADEEEWARALIKEVQLRTALHGYETTVRFLRQESWPEEPFARALVQLFYAHSLVHYRRAYSWEIGQREKVASDSELDLKAWTGDQILAEAENAYRDLWRERGAWGRETVGRIEEYFEPGTLPERIRGTFRDVVTYLWVELLADTSFWRPEHSNELYRLDFAGLLEGTDFSDNAGLLPDSDRLQDIEPGPNELSNPPSHPLERLGAILSDLEAWHRNNERPEAAFEARLERLRRLGDAFPGSAEKEAIRQHLRQQLHLLGPDHAWWSLGMATLAELVRSGGEPGQLVEAHRIAAEGASAHPKSLGGQRCAYIQASIAAPSFQVSAMASDGMGRRSVSIEHRNLPRLFFRAYALDLVDAVEGAMDFRLLPDHRRIEGILAREEPVAEWTLALPETPDYQSHRTYVTPPLEKKGLYLVVASARRGLAATGNQVQGVLVLLTDLVMISRAGAQGTEVSLRSGETGRNVEGVEVSLYLQDWKKPPRLLMRRPTGPEGTLSLPPVDRRQRAFLVARKGEDLAVDQSVLRYFGPQGREERTLTLLYTDRSVYRPGQEIHWKAVLYRGGGEASQLRVEPGAKTRIQLRDANGEEVAAAEVESNAYGSVSGSFRIPEGRLLGRWALRSNLGGSASLRVEDYKRPTFEVEMLDPEEALRLNRPARLVGEARYYFGLPVTAGEVRWRVDREPVYPRWWGLYGYPRAGAQTIARGVAEPGLDGRFEVAFTPEADPREADQSLRSSGLSYRYRLRAEVTDEGGETRSGHRVFRLGFVAVDAQLSKDWEYLHPGQKGHVRIQRRDLDGLARSGTGRWRLSRLRQPEATQLPADMPVSFPPAKEGTKTPYRTAGDHLRPRWEQAYTPERILRQWESGDEVASGELSHGEDGAAELEMPGLEAGAYRLVYETKDAYGTLFETQLELVVAEQGSAALRLPSLLLAEQDSVSVGGTVRFLVQSGLEEQHLVLEIFRGGERLRRLVLDSAEGSQLVELPVGPDLRGGFGARLICLRDHQLVQQVRSIQVPWEDRELELELATFRDRLRPGGRETWRVVVRGHDEKALAAGSAELLAYMYDRSLDLFAPHQPPNPLGLYPVHGSVPGLRSSLGIATLAYQISEDFAPLPDYPHWTPGRLKFLDGYGVGGMGARRLGAQSFSVSAEAVAASPMRSMKARAAPQAAVEVAEAGNVAAAEAAGDQAKQMEGGSGQAASEPPELRSDFSETAFWEPHLIVGDDGSVAFEFEVPDSVTEWNVWLHALTKDLRAGSLQRQARSVKELLVRPYLPRFLREGDQAEVEVVISNSGEEVLEGSLDFEILDPETLDSATETSLAADFSLAPELSSGRIFSVEPGLSTSLAFPLRVPNRVGPVAFRVSARAGDFSDGELRPLPVLPSRFHLIQSRFASLREGENRSLFFADMAEEDPSRIDDRLVVSLEGQLFYSVLSALPYLVDYPYECTEQTLNRFLSAGIVSGIFERYPAVAAMAEQVSGRESRLESWAGDDPNRKMGLEETPWLQAARGGEEPAAGLLNILDQRIAKEQRKIALDKLAKAQTSLGGFPWWPGGPPSPYMTLYILQGLSRAMEFGVEVPRPMVSQAWSYLHRHYVDRLLVEAMEKDVGWEMVTFLAYVLSNYPDQAWTGGVFPEEQQEAMLEFSFTHWRRHSPLLKGYLALALARAGRPEDARLVFDSVMDSSRTTEDEGTFWAPEDRAWLWYNDTVDSHAFALRVLSELAPEDPRRHGLVHWLMLNKKLNHWKSTRATAEAIYALVHYLQQEEALAVREEVGVTVGPLKRRFVLEPERFTGGDLQLVIPGEEIDPRSMATVEVEKEGKGLLFASATWHFSTETLPEESRGDFFAVERRFFRRRHDGREWVLEPLAEGASLASGDQVEVQLSLQAKHRAEYVHLRDPRGAGFEPESLTSGYRWNLGIGWYEEVRDSGANFFFDDLPMGQHTFKYRLRATTAGTFRVGPTTVQPMYAPEFAAYSAGTELRIEP